MHRPTKHTRVIALGAAIGLAATLAGPAAAKPLPITKRAAALAAPLAQHQIDPPTFEKRGPLPPAPVPPASRQKPDPLPVERVPPGVGQKPDPLPAQVSAPAVNQTPDLPPAA